MYSKSNQPLNLATSILIGYYNKLKQCCFGENNNTFKTSVGEKMKQADTAQLEKRHGSVIYTSNFQI